MQQAAEKLVNFIFPPKGSSWENERLRPTIILSFDEAHQLADDVYGQGWTLLTNCGLYCMSFMRCPFLPCSFPVAEKVESLDPHDIKGLNLIIEISSDDLAYVVEEGVTTLDEIAQDKWMSHLGRPLFASPFR